MVDGNEYEGIKITGINAISIRIASAISTPHRIFKKPRLRRQISVYTGVLE
jgi:hypothetical protein